MFKDTSSTSPSTFKAFIVIQSPILTRSYEATCTLATKPKIVSLNTRMITADAAPKPVKNAIGDLSNSIETIKTTAVSTIIILINCMYPLMEG